MGIGARLDDTATFFCFNLFIVVRLCVLVGSSIPSFVFFFSYYYFFWAYMCIYILGFHSLLVPFLFFSFFLTFLWVVCSCLGC